jgi:hypothetical protein
MRKTIKAATIIILIILAVWGLYFIVKKDLKPANNNARCSIQNKGLTIICDMNGQMILGRVEK